jgi:hypothetical protein
MGVPVVPRVDDRNGRHDGRGNTHGNAGQSDAHPDHDARVGRLAEHRGPEAESGYECERSESTHDGLLDCLSTQEIQRERMSTVDGVPL